MTVPRHPLDVLFEALGQALEVELARQDGALVDLPPLGGVLRPRGDMAELLEKKRRGADQRAPEAA